MMRVLPGFAVRGVVLFALWLLLVDSVDEPNMITGGVCALLAAAIATGVQSARGFHARPRVAMLRFLYRPFGLLVTDSLRVTRALLTHVLLRRRGDGSFRAVRYRAVTDEPEDVARRILTEWAASTGPNRYALGIDRQRRLLLVHELVQASGGLDPLELG